MGRQIRIRKSRPRILMATVGVALVLTTAAPSRGVSAGENGRIAFSWSHMHTSEGVGSTHISSIHPDGSGIEHISAGGYGEHAYSPDWSPNGRKIAFAFDFDWPEYLVVTRADGSHWKTITTGGSRFIDSPTWSPTSERLAYAVSSSSPGVRDNEIIRVNVDGTHKRNLTSNRRYEASPDWSSRGKIAYERRNKGPAEIYVMARDGSNVLRLTKNDVRDLTPAWSPDGRLIVWRRRESIFRMNGRGGDVMDLGVEGSSPIWSPDGEKIAYIAANGIYVMNKDGSEMELVIDESALGPDGSDIGELDWQAIGQT